MLHLGNVQRFIGQVAEAHARFKKAESTLVDFVMLSAVYEHLLPQERQRVMPLIGQL